MANEMIEIPFGTYTIPEDMTAEIKDGKIVVKKKESEDERIRKELISQVEKSRHHPADKARWIAWLEKQNNCLACDQHLKGYIAGRKATEEEKQKEPIDPFDNEQFRRGHEAGKRDAEQKPAEWSEEDEKMLADVYESLYAYQCDIRAGMMDKNAREILDDVDKEKQWLKSLRPSWKPSEEQIGALERAIVKMHTTNDISILAELRDNLKKL